MTRNSVLRLVLVIVSLGVFDRCIACRDENDEDVDGILGGNVNLTCTTNRTCQTIFWDKISGDHSIGLGQGILVGSNTSYLSKNVISFQDDGQYRCYCYDPYATYVCSVFLNGICEATAVINEKTIIYNSTSSTNYINVSEGERVGVRCPENGYSETNCRNAERRDSGRYTYRFKVSSEGNPCFIECRLRNGGLCSVHLTLNVTNLKSTAQPLPSSTRATTSSGKTSIPRTIYATMEFPFEEEKDNTSKDQPSSFLVIIPVSILIVLLVGVLCVACYLKYTSRWKSNFISKKVENVLDASHDTTIPIGPTYAVVDKSFQGCASGDRDSTKLDNMQSDDDEYAEVNSAGKGETSIEITNGAKTDTSITKDFYSVVNTSNSTKLGSRDTTNENDCAMYAEVNKEDKQSEEGNKLSPCGSRVSDVQSCHVSNQHDNLEYDTVCNVSTSSALYAVVDKEKKK